MDDELEEVHNCGGIDPFITDEIREIANERVNVRQLLIDTDCLGWGELYNRNERNDAQAFIARYIARMIVENRRNIAPTKHRGFIRTLSPLYNCARTRLGHPCDRYVTVAVEVPSGMRFFHIGVLTRQEPLIADLAKDPRFSLIT